MFPLLFFLIQKSTKGNKNKRLASCSPQWNHMVPKPAVEEKKPKLREEK
jgi:hypothetical protein